MLKIRLQRVGRVHEPTFRLVLTDSKNSTKSGRFKEILGSYDPRVKSGDSLKADRIKYWLSVGASPTDTVNNLLVTHKIISAPKINVSAKSKKAPSSAVGGEVTEDKPIEEQEKTPVEDEQTPQTAEVFEKPENKEEKAIEETPVTEELPATDTSKDDIIEKVAPTLSEGEVGVPTQPVSGVGKENTA